MKNKIIYCITVLKLEIKSVVSFNSLHYYTYTAPIGRRSIHFTTVWHTYSTYTCKIIEIISDSNLIRDGMGGCGNGQGYLTLLELFVIQHLPVWMNLLV